MTFRPEVQEAVNWYSQNRLVYQILAERVANIIQEVLQTNNLNYHSITHRAKTLESYKEKASKGIYYNPVSEIKDMAGIRVITFTDSDAKSVFDIIKKTFDLEDIIDKTKELGIDRVGYRSIQGVGTLGGKRLKLPENKNFKDMCFEIQVRTILQHAWAEFEHDRNYKFRGVLPFDIKRRLSILAGCLELLDREFDDISRAIDRYTLEVKEKTELGDLSIPIDSTSLKAYMDMKFEPLIKLGIQPDFARQDNLVIHNLSTMGIHSIKELNDIIPNDYVERKSKIILSEAPNYNFNSIIIDVLIIHNAKTFFDNVIPKNGVLALAKSNISFFREYSVDLNPFKHKITMMIELKTKVK